MPNEKEVSQMNSDELRAALAQFTQSQQPARPQQPDAPGFGVGDSAASRDTAATLYGNSIMRKQPGALSPQEREFLAASIGPALRDLGY
jgi:hypothetical protein